MKPITTTLLILLLLCGVSATAQQQKNDIEISGGLGYISDFDLTFRSGFFDYRSDYSYYNIDPKPIASLSFKSFFTEEFSYNIGITYHKVGYTLGGPDAKDTFHHISRVFTVAAGAQANYYSSKYLSIYAQIEGGLAAATADEYGTGVALSGYISPLGIRLGSTHAVYAEVGFGNKGLYNVGYSLRLRGHKKQPVKDESQL